MVHCVKARHLRYVYTYLVVVAVAIAVVKSRQWGTTTAAISIQTSPIP